MRARIRSGTGETGAQLEDRFVDLCRAAAGAPVVFRSAPNLDRFS